MQYFIVTLNNIRDEVSWTNSGSITSKEAEGFPKLHECIGILEVPELGRDIVCYAHNNTYHNYVVKSVDEEALEDKMEELLEIYQDQLVAAAETD